jgi:hypothetical protein
MKLIHHTDEESSIVMASRELAYGLGYFGKRYRATFTFCLAQTKQAISMIRCATG